MKRLWFLLPLLCISAVAQNFTQVTAANIYGGSNALLTSGTVSFQAVDNTGAPIPYQVGGGGQQITYPTVCGVSNGAIIQPCNVANVAVTNPLDVCFVVTVKDSSSNVVLGGSLTSGYGCVQPQTYNSSVSQSFWCSTSGGLTTCNFDNYIPNSAGVPTARVALPGPSTLGGVFSQLCPSPNVMSGVAVTGLPNCVSPTSIGYPAAGVAVSTGSAWGASLAAPASALVGVSDTQTLTNKTLDGVTPTVMSYLDATSSIQTQLNSKVPTSTTVNGNALTGNIVISASQITTGTLPHAQLPALLSADIPNNTANTTGNAATATALGASPTNCSSGNAPTGIAANGNAQNCSAIVGYPAAGVAVSTGSAWGSSLTAPASALVGISDTQTLTNKSINASEVNSGTLPHAQLPALLSGDIPNNAANTSGSSGSFTGNLGGDVTGTQSATVVGGLRGITLPTLAGSTGYLYDNNGTLSLSTSASNLTTGTLPHAQLPTLLSGDIPNNAANTSGNAATSTSLAAAPTLCSTGNAPTGILANGNATGCAPFLSTQVYPGAGVANSTGSAWGTSYTVGTAANNLVQLNGSAQLPAVSAALLTNFPTFNQSTTGNAATATALAATPTLCSTGQAPTGILANGNATGCAVYPTQTYPGAGVANSTGSAWGTSYTVGTSANNLVQLNGSAQLPAVSGALLTNLAAVTSVDGSASLGAETVVSGSVAAITGTGTIRASDVWGTKSGSYTFVDTDRGHTYVTNDGSNDIYTLPTPTSTTFQNGWFATIKNGSSTSTVAFTPVSPTTIDGQASIALFNQTLVTIVSDGANYHTTNIGTIANNSANLFFASPNGSTGLPSMRAIMVADVPTLNQNTTGNAATATTATTATNLASGSLGSLAYQTGAGATAFLSGNTAATDQVVVSHGSGSAALAPTLSNAPALSAANMTSFPTLNQNTTGNAATSTTASSATKAQNLANGNVGSVPYQTGANATAFLLGNALATDQVLVSHGTGSVALAPTLSNAPALSAANMTSFPTLNQNTTGSAGTLSGCSVTTAGDFCVYTGTLFARVPANASGLTQALVENSSGTPSWSSLAPYSGAITCTQSTPCASSPTTLFTTGGSSALYRVSAAGVCMTNNSSTVNLTISYTDPSGTAQTITPATAASCVSLGSASVVNLVQAFPAENATAIQYNVTTTGSPVYQLRVIVQQVSVN